jgi:CRP/FNR family transcriptional regulator, cyclic AMP receptor protein
MPWSSVNGTPDVVRVLEVDPDLAQDLEPAALAVARPRAIARAQWLEPGRWQPLAEEWDHRGHLGLLIVDGFLTRSLRLGARRTAELLGPGDVLRPWVRLGEYSSIPVEDGWDVLEPARLAILDRRVAVALAGWPEITAAILDRMMARSSWLAFHLAVAHLRRVDTRVHVALWHFADRWGRMGPNGAEMRLNMTHALLAEIVAAERPSVTLALSALRERGLVERDAEHVWRLHGRPPGELDDVRAQAAGPLR